MKKHVFEQLENLVVNKTFSELTTEEHDFVMEQVGSEKAFNELKTMIELAKSQAIVPTENKTRSDLTRYFKAKHKKSYPSWIRVQVPVYLNAIILLILALGLWQFLPEKEVIVEKKVTEYVTLPADTITISAPADTIYIEKIVKINQPIYIEKVAETKEEQERKVKAGKPLSKQQGLKELLVTGK